MPGCCTNWRLVLAPVRRLKGEWGIRLCHSCLLQPHRIHDPMRPFAGGTELKLSDDSVMSSRLSYLPYRKYRVGTTNMLSSVDVARPHRMTIAIGV